MSRKPGKSRRTAPSSATSPETQADVSLAALFWIFFRIACTSFGGFMAMIALVQNVVVERRRLLSSQAMLDGISLASVLPGPVAVNLVVYVGYRLRGGVGALVSGVAAVLPAFVFIVVLSFAYFEWGQIPAVTKLFQGFVPAVTAIIVVAAWNMGRKACGAWREVTLAVAAAIALIGIGGFYVTAAIIAAAGVIGWLWFGERAPAAKAAPRGPGSGVLALIPIAPLFAFEPTLLSKIFITFAGMSLMLFGGAYVFIPLMQGVVVEQLHWVTTQEFVDAVALGQVTPGPVLVSAAFIGLKIAGLAGAIVATAGIFLPSALVTIACSHALGRVQHSRVVAAALRGIRAAVVGLIFAAAVSVGATAAPVWVSAVIFVAALAALWRWRVEAVWIIPSAGLLGLALY